MLETARQTRRTCVSPNSPANEGRAEVGEETRLFDVYTPDKHTVLVFASDNGLDKTKAILSALEKYPPGLIRSALVLAFDFIDHGRCVFGVHIQGPPRSTRSLGYGVKEDHLQVVVVRPDGVIGAFVEGGRRHN